MRDRPFVEVLRAFDELWRVYARPWDAFADVSAVAGDAITARRRLRDLAPAKAVQRADAGRLLDCVEGLWTVKRDLEHAVPAGLRRVGGGCRLRSSAAGRGRPCRSRAAGVGRAGGGVDVCDFLICA